MYLFQVSYIRYEANAIYSLFFIVYTIIIWTLVNVRLFDLASIRITYIFSFGSKVPEAFQKQKNFHIQNQTDSLSMMLMTTMMMYSISILPILLPLSSKNMENSCHVGTFAADLMDSFGIVFSPTCFLHDFLVHVLNSEQKKIAFICYRALYFIATKRVWIIKTLTSLESKNSAFVIKFKN